MRSLLFIPADDEKKLGKGLATGADALILDLEDAVSLPRKAAARALAAQYIADTRPHEGRPRIYVRINALDTELWQDDVSSVAGMRPDGILLPKARSGEDVHKLSIALNHEEERAGAPMGATRIVALVTETPISLLQLHTYVDSSSRLEGLTWGAEDLSAVLGARSNREDDGRAWTSPYRLARDLTLFAAAAAGVQAIDTVFVNFRDAEGLRPGVPRGGARRLHGQDGNPPEPGRGDERGFHAERGRGGAEPRDRGAVRRQPASRRAHLSRADGGQGARGPRRAHPRPRQGGRDGKSPLPASGERERRTRCGTPRRRRSARVCARCRHHCPSARSTCRWTSGRRSRPRDGARPPRRRPAATSACPSGSSSKRGSARARRRAECASTSRTTPVAAVRPRNRSRSCRRYTLLGGGDRDAPCRCSRRRSCSTRGSRSRRRRAAQQQPASSRQATQGLPPPRQESSASSLVIPVSLEVTTGCAVECGQKLKSAGDASIRPTARWGRCGAHARAFTPRL